MLTFPVQKLWDCAQFFIERFHSPVAVNEGVVDFNKLLNFTKDNLAEVLDPKGLLGANNLVTATTAAA